MTKTESMPINEAVISLLNNQTRRGHKISQATRPIEAFIIATKIDSYEQRIRKENAMGNNLALATMIAYSISKDLKQRLANVKRSTFGPELKAEIDELVSTKIEFYKSLSELPPVTSLIAEIGASSIGLKGISDDLTNIRREMSNDKRDFIGNIVGAAYVVDKLKSYDIRPEDSSSYTENLALMIADQWTAVDLNAEWDDGVIENTERAIEKAWGRTLNYREHQLIYNSPSR